MKKVLITLALAGALGLGLSVSQGPAAPTLGDKVVRYEYAELRVYRTVSAPAGMPAPRGGGFGGAAGRGGPGGGGFQPGGPGGPGGFQPGEVETTVRWATGEEEVVTKDWEELGDKLKAPSPKKTSPSNVHRLRVLNKLTADGWELMEHPPADTTPGTLVFRRPAK